MPWIVSIELLLKGRLDAVSADSLADEISRVVDEGATVVRLNLSELEYLSSAGLRIIIKYWKQLSATGRTLSVTRPSPAALMVMNLAGIQDLIEQSA